MRDAWILPDVTSQTYFIVSSVGPTVRIFVSRDLVTWEGPHVVFRMPPDFWVGAEARGIWAPELHCYRGRYYLFLTVNTATELPEQWRDWLPRVRRGCQVLVGDSPLGPFAPFARGPTLPAEIMTLDGTLWVEDGIPWMVFCHEWVQIVDGTVEMIQLREDLSATVGEPVRLFAGSDAPWSRCSDRYGCWVTDGPSLYRSPSGRLFMIWSSGGSKGYTTGIAVSESGRLAGPWWQRAEPLFEEDGGHGCIFRRFDNQLMLALHQPNKYRERAHLFELEDTGEILRIARSFP
jgi:GH43 family beta-xylosidase